MSNGTEQVQVITSSGNDGAKLSGSANFNTLFYEDDTVGSSIADSPFGGSGGTNALRIPGLVLQAESATTDPFSSTVGATESVDITRFTNISVLDIRTGTDSLSSASYNGHQYIRGGSTISDGSVSGISA